MPRSSQAEIEDFENGFLVLHLAEGKRNHDAVAHFFEVRAVHLVPGEVSRLTDGLEKLGGFLDGFLGDLLVGTFETENTSAVLCKFRGAEGEQLREDCRRGDGERLSVVESVEGRQLVTDHVCAPVLVDANGKMTVECFGGAEHEICPVAVLGLFHQICLGDFDQGGHQALGFSVLESPHVVMARVLLKDMDVSVSDAVTDLSHRRLYV